MTRLEGFWYHPAVRARSARKTADGIKEASDPAALTARPLRRSLIHSGVAPARALAYMRPSTGPWRTTQPHESTRSSRGLGLLRARGREDLFRVGCGSAEGAESRGKPRPRPHGGPLIRRLVEAQGRHDPGAFWADRARPTLQEGPGACFTGSTRSTRRRQPWRSRTLSSSRSNRRASSSAGPRKAAVIV